MDKEKLIKNVIDAAYTVSKTLGPGYPEIVYRRALAHELSLRGIKFEEESPIKIFYKDTVVGDYRCDILVENVIILELKACESLIAAHEAQLVNYLVATGIDSGLLFNFGAPKLQIKRKWRVYTPKKHD